MSVIVENRTPQVVAEVTVRAAAAARMLAERIVSQAEPKTPMRGGQLRINVRKEMLGLHGQIVWQTAYAEVQERGTWLTGSHAGVPITNYTTAGTGAWFAKDAVESVATASNFAMFLGGLS